MNDNFRRKIQIYEKKKLEAKKKYEECVSSIDKIINSMSENCEIYDTDNFNTIVFKKYLELENVREVSQYINELGHRVKTDSYVGQRKYNGNDITKIILTADDVEEELKSTVSELHIQHSISIMKRYW